MDEICYIDYETYSPTDIDDGTYNYTNDTGFRPLLLSFCFGDGPVGVWEFNSKHPFKLPHIMFDHFLEGGKFAAFGQFDRYCLDRSLLRKFQRRLPINRYIDVSILCREVGIPGSLAGAATTLELETRKNPQGKEGIKWFSIPDEHGNRRLPASNPKLWQVFKDYASDDTVICRELHKRLPPLGVEEQKLYELDCNINDRGIRIDRTGAKRLQKMAKHAVKDVNLRLCELTDGAVERIDQVSRIAEYLGIDSAAEKALENAQETEDWTETQKTVAQARLDNAKSSVRKLPRMISQAGRFDDRCRGQLQFCGTHTKRWAGRGFQPQNLPRESWKPHEVDDVVKFAGAGYPLFKQNYPQVLDAIAKSMRGMILPAPGHRLICADYSQIEARLVAWYAGQTDALDIYESGGDIYKEMASSVFQKPVAEISSGERFIGKTLILGSGYGLGWRGLQRNLKNQAGVEASDEEAQTYTKAFRMRFSQIPTWWWNLREALMNAVSDIPSHNKRTGLKFNKMGTSVYVEIATGARCWFHKARITTEPTPWDPDQYHNVVKATRYSAIGHPMEYTVTHMILAENICSMSAREIMGAGMLRLNDAGFDIIMTVHDEAVMEVPLGWDADEHVLLVQRLMATRPAWCQDLPIAVEAFAAKRYCK